jgi:FtsH-binding integral membrane protein
MFEGKVRSVVIDLCSKCDGIWLDRGELAQLANLKDDTPEKAVGQPTSYRCPRCAGPLEERPFTSDSGILIDMCARCKGVYLDKGELQKIQDFAQQLDTVFTPGLRQSNQRRAERMDALAQVYHTENPAAKHSIDERVKFVRDVYALLLVTLAVTALAALVGIKTGISIQYFWPLLIAEIVVFLVLIFGLRRTPGWNVAGLLVYNALFGLTLGAILEAYIQAGLGHIIWQATGLTAAIFAVLSAYIHFTKKDLSFMGGFLFIALIGLVVGGIVFIFVGSARGVFIYSIISAVVFSGYILYDTSRILLKYDTSEVVSAVIDLYLDIVNLFLDLLRILAYLNRR